MDQINTNYRNGVITEGERYNRVINTWTHATTEVEQVTFDGLAKDRDGFNPIFMTGLWAETSGKPASKRMITTHLIE